MLCHFTFNLLNLDQNKFDFISVWVIKKSEESQVQFSPSKPYFLPLFSFIDVAFCMCLTVQRLWLCALLVCCAGSNITALMTKWGYHWTWDMSHCIPLDIVNFYFFSMCMCARRRQDQCRQAEVIVFSVNMMPRQCVRQ